ncbi:hypothetical protein [Streptomyces sp. YJ-C3]
MAAVVTQLTLLVGMTCTVLFAQPTLGDAALPRSATGSAPTGCSRHRGRVCPRPLSGRCGEIGGATVTEVVRSTVRVGLDKYPAQGLTSTGPTRTWDSDVTAGSLGGFGAGSVAGSELAADQQHLNPASPLKVALGDGMPVMLTIAEAVSSKQ